MREWMMALMTKSAINTPQTGTSTVVFGIPPRMAFGTLPPDGVIVAIFSMKLCKIPIYHGQESSCVACGRRYISLFKSAKLIVTQIGSR